VGELKDELKRVLNQGGVKLAKRHKEDPKPLHPTVDTKLPGPAPIKTAKAPTKELTKHLLRRTHRPRGKEPFVTPLQPVSPGRGMPKVNNARSPLQGAPKLRIQERPIGKIEPSARFVPTSPGSIRIRYPDSVGTGQFRWETVGKDLSLEPDRRRPKASCVLGLDFCTAYTKACVRFRGSSVFVISWACPFG
jgi:hypothetical protein